MSSHQITPDETHVIKAMAWDALAASLTMGLATLEPTTEEVGQIQGMIGLMDSMLERVGDKVSKSSTWGIGMAKKFQNDDYYKCVACGTATQKGDWQQLFLEGVSMVFSKCPHCGGIYDLTAGNEIEPVPVQEPDAPEPEPKPAAKKPAAKKPAAKK